MLGLLLTGVLVVRRTRAAILLGVVLTTLVAMVVEAVLDVGPAVVAPGRTDPDGWQLDVPALPDAVVGLPELSLLGDSLFGSVERVGGVAALLLVLTLLLADFDTRGTVVGVGAEAGLLDPVTDTLT